MGLTTGTTQFERVVVVHGFRASPQHHWFPWIADAVAGAEVVGLPASAAPDAEAWIGTVTRALGTLGPEVAVVAVSPFSQAHSISWPRTESPTCPKSSTH